MDRKSVERGPTVGQDLFLNVDLQVKPSTATQTGRILASFAIQIFKEASQSLRADGDTAIFRCTGNGHPEWTVASALVGQWVKAHNGPSLKTALEAWLRACEENSIDGVRLHGGLRVQIHHENGLWTNLRESELWVTGRTPWLFLVTDSPQKYQAPINLYKLTGL